MDQQQFWGIVESAKSAAIDRDSRPDALRQELKKLSPAEVQGFYEVYARKLIQAYTWPLWGAAYVMNGGCSDDCFDYFRDWLISEGQSVYENALDDPDSLADLPSVEEPRLELYRYIPDEVYEEQAGQPMKPNLPERPMDPAGEEWDEDSVGVLFPRLTDIYD